MSRPVIEPGPPRWGASTIERSQSNSFRYSEPLQFHLFFVRYQKINYLVQLQANRRVQQRARCRLICTGTVLHTPWVGFYFLLILRGLGISTNVLLLIPTYNEEKSLTFQQCVTSLKGKYSKIK
jgi:hypothetical protein